MKGSAFSEQAADGKKIESGYHCLTYVLERNLQDTVIWRRQDLVLKKKKIRVKRRKEAVSIIPLCLQDTLILAAWSFFFRMNIGVM